MDSKFFTAGKAIFTVRPAADFALRNNTQLHYTYKITRKEGAEPSCPVYFISLLTGPDNTANYTYLGMLRAFTGEVVLTKASRYNDDSWPVRIIRRVIGRAFADDLQAIEATGWSVYHEGRCGRCGRALTVPQSIESGIGPECAKVLA